MRILSAFALAALLLLSGSVGVGQGSGDEAEPRAASATWAPPFAVDGADTDNPPDGRYDIILVRASVNVTEAGEFYARACISFGGCRGRSLGLAVGVHNVEISFETDGLRERNYSGPVDVQLYLSATGSPLDERTAFSSAPFSSSSWEDFDAEFNLTGPSGPDTALDLDSDGLSDVVAISLPVIVRENGSYTIQGQFLLGGQGRIMENHTRLTAGDATVRLDIPGDMLSQANHSGQISVTLGMNRFKLGGGWSQRTYATRSYEGRQFSDAPARVTTARLTGMDTDSPPDGGFDLLEVEFDVDARLGADYYIVVYMDASNGSELGPVSGYAYVPRGGGHVRVSIPAVRFLATQATGPYNVSATLYTESDRILATRWFIRDGPPWTAFDPPPLRIAGPVSDAWSDIDLPPDGVLDEYIVRVPVDVREPGRYVFDANVDVGGWAISGANVTRLPAGRTEVGIRWSASSLAGTLGAAWVLVRDDRSEVLASASWVPTPPGGALAPVQLTFTGPRQVELPDADGDGLIDAVLVTSSVRVARPGDFLITGVLQRESMGWAVASAASRLSLPEGDNNVTLRFPGWSVRASGQDGPYLATVGWGRAWTRAYTPTLRCADFEDDRPAVRAAWTPNPPTLDGAIGPREWDGATAIDLTPATAGGARATAFLANDDQFLYVGIDAVGDRTEDELDSAGLGFDVRHLDHEDSTKDFQLGLSTSTFLRTISGDTWRDWRLRQSPVLQDSPAREGLVMNRSFGPSPGESTAHRTYEFRIPMGMLETTPASAGVVGIVMGIADGLSASSSWPMYAPSWSGLPFSSYGRVTLAKEGETGDGGDLPPTAGPPVALYGAAAGGGIAVGLAVAWIAIRRRRRQTAKGHSGEEEQ